MNSLLKSPFRLCLVCATCTSALLAAVPASAASVTNAQVFAYVAANFASVFSGTPAAGQYQQFDYRLFPGTGNIVAIDTGGVLYALGPITNNTLTPLGPVSAFADQIATWEASQPHSVLVGGTVQGTPMALASAVTTFAGTNGQNGTESGIGLAARFSQPLDITTDGSNLYVIDRGTQRIRKVVIATGAVSFVAGNGLSGPFDGIGALASFYNPTGITTDGTHLFVTEGTNTIRKVVIATGAVTTLSGRCPNNTCPASESAAGAAALYYNPTGLTTDGTYLYVADRSYNRIQKVSIATGAATVLAGGGGPFSTNFNAGNIDGVGAIAAFTNPTGITSDGTHLYVAETNQIRKIVIATGLVSTLASGITTPFVLDDKGEASAFGNHTHMTTDGTHLYATNGTRVRKIVIATGAITTLAGSGADAASTRGNLDGTGTAAIFANPLGGITSDGVSLFVADSQIHVIRRIK